MTPLSMSLLGAGVNDPAYEYYAEAESISQSEEAGEPAAAVVDV